MDNADPERAREIRDASRDEWWDPRGAFRTLHDINELRLDYIDRRSPLAGAACSTSDAAAACSAKGSRGAARTCSESISPSRVSRRRASTRRTAAWRRVSLLDAETVAREHAGEFDVVTCLEMLEHVPDPHEHRRGLRRGAASRRRGVLLDDQPQPEELRARDRGRGVRARASCRAGRHEYLKMIRPSELAAWCRRAALRGRRAHRACTSIRCSGATRSAATST